VLATGFAPSSSEVDPHQTELTITLPASCSLTLSIPDLELPRGHHLAVLDAAGDTVFRAALPAAGDLRIASLPTGPVDLRIEADVRLLRRVAGVFDASYLVSFANPPPLIRWSRRVQMQVDRDPAIVVESLPPLNLVQLDVQIDGDLSDGRLSVTRLAPRGHASGRPRLISVPISDRRIRIGGLEAGEYAVEVVAANGRPWWWAFSSIVDGNSPCSLVVRATDRHECRFADQAWQAGSHIHRVTADGHPLRWSTVAVGDPVCLSPGSYQVLSAAGRYEAQFTVGPSGSVTMQR
jgi:hypothetical protein